MAGEGQTFANAVVAFITDDSQLKAGEAAAVASAEKTVKTIEATATASAKRIGEQMSSAMSGGAGGPGGFFSKAGDPSKAFADKIGLSLKGIEQKAKDSGMLAGTGFSGGFQKGLHGASQPLEDVGSKIGGVVRLLTNPMALIGAAAAAVGAALIKAGAAGFAFDRDMQNLSPFLDKTSMSTSDLRGAILDLNPNLATAGEYAKAMGIALQDSAGNAQNALEIVSAAAGLAKASGTDLNTATETIGALKDAYGELGLSAEEASDKLLLIAQKGGGSIKDLGPALINAADAGANLGVSLDEVGGFLIAMGEAAGASPKRNLTALQQAFTVLNTNVEEFRRRGVDIQNVIKTEGLVAGLRKLKDVTGGSAEQLKEMGFQGRSINQIMKLISDDGLAKLEAAQNKVKNSSGATADAIKERGQFISGYWDKVVSGFERDMVRLGNAMVDPMGAATRAAKTQDVLTAANDRMVASAARQVAENKRLAQAQTKTNETTATQAKLMEALADAQAKLDTDRLIRGYQKASDEAKRGEDVLKAQNAAMLKNAETAFAMEQAQAQAQGRTVRGLEELQAVRKRVLDEGYQATIATLAAEDQAQAQAFEAERKRIQDQIDAKKADRFFGSDLKAQADVTALQNQVEATQQKIADATANSVAKRKQAEAQYSADVRAEDLKRFQERQAQIVAAQQLEAQGLQNRRALGQATVEEAIALNQKWAADANLTAQTRVQAEIEAQNLIRKQLQDTVALSIAQNKMSQTEYLGFVAAEVQAHKQGTQQRIDAEKQYADQVKSVRDSIASTGNALIDAAIAKLKEQGQTQLSVAQIQAKAAELGREAQTTLNNALEGGVVSADRLKSAMTLSPQFAALQKDGVSAFSAIGVAVQKSADAFDPMAKSTDEIAEDMARLGVKSLDVADTWQALRAAGVNMTASTKAAVDGLREYGYSTADIVRKLTDGLTKADKSADAFDASVTDASSHLSDGFEKGYKDTLTATDTFLTSLNTKIASGTSRIADTIYEGFINRVIRALDAEAARS